MTSLLFLLLVSPLGSAHVDSRSDTGEAGSLEFDLFDDPLALPPPNQPSDDALQSRRSLLTYHQLAGLTTLGAMGATTAVGIASVRDLYSDGGARTGRYRMAHRISAYSTALLFSTTAAFALLAPQGYQREQIGITRPRVHKAFALIASAGMVAQIGLGIVTARRADAGNPNRLNQLAGIHTVLGLTTTAALVGAGLTWVF